MPLIGIRIVSSATAGRSWGHVYIVLTDNSGAKTSYGFYPATAGFLGTGVGPGAVSGLDLNEYENNPNKSPDLSRDFDISDADFAKMKGALDNSMDQAGDLTKPWGHYNPLTNSCVDFAWNALREAGVAPLFFDGVLYPEWNNKFVDETYYDFYRRPEFNRELRADRTIADELERGIRVISGLLSINPDPLVKIIRYIWVDPLVLDLDGDGLEISPLSRGVQFDTNGDTIRTNTSWVQADDGLLVLDRNGNGVIDSGRELFGDETLLADGKKAAHGFAALAELDVGGAANATGGAGDGVFDAKDAQYARRARWRQRARLA
jgi:hypothetical protein